jgi:hypothetical protein
VAGPLVGVGIKDDIDKFNDMLELVFGKRLIFGNAIDAAVVGRLAGVNISKHSVQALVWLCLGGHLPKDRASVGDNTFEELPQALQLYIRGDTTQLGLAVWILLCCWVAHMFPDLHAVFKVSRARSAGDLLSWWFSEVVTLKLRLIHKVPQWTPVTHRDLVPRALGIDDNFGKWLTTMTPDWPSISAGGCRYAHSCRAWLASRMDPLISADGQFWLRSYREEGLLLRLGLLIPPAPSPTDPTSSTHLAPNPGLENIIHVPANQFTRAILNRSVFAGHPKRPTIVEYALFNPHEAPLLLLRIEQDRRYEASLFAAPQKVGSYVRELREFLGPFGLLPSVPPAGSTPSATSSQRTSSAALIESTSTPLAAPTTGQRD